MVNKMPFAIALLLFCCVFSTFAQGIIEVPVSSAPGYSVFHPSIGGIVAEAEDSPFRLELRGVPKNLKNITRHQFKIDEKQFFYQLFIGKKISKEMFDQWMQLLKYVPNEGELSKEPLRVSVYVIVGEDENGSRVWLADTDTDLDFSDEQARPLLLYAEPLNFGKYQNFADNAVQIEHQRFRDGKVVEETLPLAIIGMPEDGQVYFNFPRHYTAAINDRGRAYEIAIESGGFISNGLDEQNSSLVVLTDRARNRTVDLSVPVRPNQYFYLGNEMYQYLGVDGKKSVARVRKVQHPDRVQSAQVGFPTLDFKGKDLKTGKEVAIKQLKGKYVLLDFWATWCGPCIKEFPRLKALTSQYDRSKFEIVGVVGRSEPEDVAKLIDKHGLTWAQVLSDEIVAQHGISVYPATLLVSPEGKVLYKDIRGEELEKVLAELIK